MEAIIMENQKSIAVTFILTLFVSSTVVNTWNILCSIMDITLGNNKTNNIELIISYIIIVLINTIIIIKGGRRVTEVSYRFSLDGFPGKCMSIEAELNGKYINLDEANGKKVKLSNKLEFLNQMNVIAKIIETTNKIIIIFQSLIVVILEICYRLLKIDVGSCLNDILKYGILMELIIALIFVLIGALVSRKAK
jgi:flagellar biosynthesis protein FlhA